MNLHYVARFALHTLSTNSIIYIIRMTLFYIILSALNVSFHKFVLDMEVSDEWPTLDLVVVCVCVSVMLTRRSRTSCEVLREVRTLPGRRRILSISGALV